MVNQVGDSLSDLLKAVGIIGLAIVLLLATIIFVDLFSKLPVAF